jgi:hypothetical protein
VNLEASSVRYPRDNVVQTLSLDFGQNLVQLDWEQDYTATFSVVMADYCVLSTIAIVVDRKMSSVVVSCLARLGTCALDLLVGLEWPFVCRPSAAVAWTNTCTALHNGLVAPGCNVHGGKCWMSGF